MIPKMEISGNIGIIILVRNMEVTVIKIAKRAENVCF